MNHSGTRCSWGSFPKRYKTCSIIETFPSSIPLPSSLFRCWFGPLAVAVFLFGNFFLSVRCCWWLATLGDIKINRNDQQFLADASKQEQRSGASLPGRRSGKTVEPMAWNKVFSSLTFFHVFLQSSFSSGYCCNLSHIVSPLFFLHYRWRLVNVQSVMVAPVNFKSSVLCLGQ